MSVTLGELCAGYGGLGIAVSRVLDARLAWYSEIDRGALKVLEHRFPGIPNIGDMTTVDWANFVRVDHVDILTAGYPCQPFSHAGKRKGANDERHLWPYVREAIRHLRPRITFLENVAGHRTLGFDRVLGDLAEDGMRVAWVSVRASDAGAAHQRERLFIAVTPDDNDEGLGGLRGLLAERRDTDGCRGEDGLRQATEPATLLPTPRTSDTNGAGRHGDGGLDLRTAVSLLPTPRATDGTKGGPNQRGSSGDLMLPSAVQPQRFGKYAAAVARWESLTRPAPEPTEVGPKGNRRLSARFDEWHMGLPDGWITDVPGITWGEAVKLCGNGVVPQAAALAFDFLLDVLSSEAAAA